MLASTRPSRCRRTRCGRRSRAGSPGRPPARAPTSGPTGCWTSAAARCRTSRSSSRTCAKSLGWTRGRTRARRSGADRVDPRGRGSFDVVLCAQVLEHVDDPAQGIREIARVTRRGGRVLLSTHGAMVYHPNPSISGAGRAPASSGCSRTNGDWASVTVSAGSGTASSLAMLNAIYLEHLLRRTPLRAVRGPVVALLNRAARALDRRVALLRDERPGTIAANYHVVAERAS